MRHLTPHTRIALPDGGAVLCERTAGAVTWLGLYAGYRSEAYPTRVLAEDWVHGRCFAAPP